MNLFHTSKTTQKLFEKRNEILKELKNKRITIYTHDSWQDAIPQDYKDMKELQTHISTIIS